MAMVELVVSELATNAYTYAPGPFLLELGVKHGAVGVTVWDTDPTLPTTCPADPGRGGRHGLEVVLAVCRSFEVRREPVGRRARAEVVLADDPAQHPPGRLR
jgi:anti-sigma regulatory factor (Ser/Thr protein kinase)